MNPNPIIPNYRPRNWAEFFSDIMTGNRSAVCGVVTYILANNGDPFPLLNLFSTQKSLSDYRWVSSLSAININRFLRSISHNLPIQGPGFQVLQKQKWFDHLDSHRLLTIDQHGRHYYGASVGRVGNDDSTLLYICDPYHEGFVSIDVTSEEATFNEKYGNDKITRCIPTENGFVLFSEDGFGLWTFQSTTSRPQMTNFLPIEKDKFLQIVFLGHFEEKCFFRVDSRKEYEVMYCDLKKEEIISVEYSDKTAFESPYYLGNRSGKLYWNDSEVQIVDNRVAKIINPMAEKKSSLTQCFTFKNWTISRKEEVKYKNAFGLQVKRELLVINDSDDWMDPDRLLFPNYFTREQFFFVDDFLVLSYEPSSDKRIRLIHLPSKKEYCTKKMCELIERQFKGLNWILFYLKINSEVIELFVQIRNRPEEYTLQSITVSFKDANILMPSSIEPQGDKPPKSISEKVQPKAPNTQKPTKYDAPFETSSSSSESNDGFVINSEPPRKPPESVSGKDQPKNPTTTGGSTEAFYNPFGSLTSSSEDSQSHEESSKILGNGSREDQPKNPTTTGGSTEAFYNPFGNSCRSSDGDTDIRSVLPNSDGTAVTSEKGAAPDSEGLHQVLPNTLLKTQGLETSQEKVPAIQTVHKVILVAGAVFLLLTIAVSIPLGILHPGKVVFEGSGMILTLPLLMTLSSGGGASLTLIAVGTYHWWINRKNREQAKIN